ncbi:hypothetical protein HY333_01955 [Candidatus Collierbacteria bacterium]|nr:hypothetical protein [Candidatus Collierbacteria bacterium]
MARKRKVSINPSHSIDRMIAADQSPIAEETRSNEGLMISGKIGIGKKGHQVTIVVEDEETGETMEINHVNSALLIIEDQRRSSNGWLCMAIGQVEKLGDVLEFLAKMTLSGIKNLVKRA